MLDYITTSSLYYLKYGIVFPPITSERCEYILNSPACDTVMGVKNYFMSVNDQVWDFEYINTYLNFLSITAYYCLYIGFIIGLCMVFKNIYTTGRLNYYTYIQIPGTDDGQFYKTILLPLNGALILSCAGPLLIIYGMLTLIRTIIRVHELPANIKALYKRIYNIVYPEPILIPQSLLDLIQPHQHQSIRNVVHTDFIEDKPGECPICWESLDEIDQPLSCGHYMHRSCLLNAGKTRCGICRQEVYLSDDELATIESNQSNQ